MNDCDRKPQGVGPRLFSYRQTAILCTVLAIATGLVAWRVFFHGNGDIKRGLEALRRAFPTQRPFEARVSVLGYTPYLATRGRDEPQLHAVELDNAERLLGEAYYESKRPESAHGLGLLYLARGKLELA